MQSDECSRRMSLMEQCRGKPLERPVFDDKISCLSPDVDQRPVVLYNVAHSGRSPTPADTSDPGLRLLGVFNRREEAIEHAIVLSKKHECLDYMMTPLGEWFMMHTDREKPQEIVEQRVVLRLEKHRSRRDRDFKQLKAARDKQLQSRTSYQKEERFKRSAAAPGVATADATRDTSSNVRTFPSKRMCANQRFAVVSVLVDKDKQVRLGRRLPEPIVRVYGCFNSQKQARTFIREELASHVGEFDIDVVDMYEWLFPQSLDPEKIEEEFRDSEINDIMQHAKVEKKLTRDFRQKCAALGKEPDMAYVAGSMGGDSISLVSELQTIADEESLEDRKGVSFKEITETTSAFNESLNESNCAFNESLDESNCAFNESNCETTSAFNESNCETTSAFNESFDKSNCAFN